MSAVNEMLNGALALERALALARDWRVRSALADAATIVRASRFIQQKIDAGQLKIETESPARALSPLPKTPFGERP
jgi:hypothetical protein